MIKTLEVTNLQGHKYSLLEFHKGVNVIKGTSHHGKSSLIRALKWALLNRPSGFHFKSHFSKPKDSTDVSIEFDNNDWISRERNNSFNGYKLSSIDSSLEALRTNIPDEVKALTRMNDINLQSQADKYFMLQETPGTVGKELNKIVGLSIIDEVNKKVTKIVNDANTESKRLTNELKEKKEEIKKYKHLNKIGKQIEQITDLNDSYTAMEENRNILTLKITEINEKKAELSDLDEWLEIEKPFKEIKRKQARLIQLQSKEIAISSLINDYEKIQITSERVEEILSLEKDTKSVKMLLSKLSEMQNKHVKLSKLYEDVINIKKALKLSSDTLKIKIKEKSELLKSHVDEFCSKCGAHQQYWRKK